VAFATAHMITPGPVCCPPADETLARLNEPERSRG
jgi:hypothetical protein